MKIFVTRPAGLMETVLIQRLTKRWTNLNAVIVAANPGRIHGETLTDLWQEALNTGTKKIVISELDFIPYDTFHDEMNMMLEESSGVFVHNARREPDGELVTYPDLAGPWLLGVNLALLDRLPPLNWLDAGGPFNDAANLALQNFKGCSADDPIVVNNYDCFPDALGLEYDGLGYHAFWNRHFDDPPGTILWAGVTVDQHLADIVARLDALEAK